MKFSFHFRHFLSTFFFGAFFCRLFGGERENRIDVKRGLYNAKIRSFKFRYRRKLQTPVGLNVWLEYIKREKRK